MMYVTIANGERVYFDNIDAMFEFVNSRSDATGGWIGS